MIEYDFGSWGIGFIFKARGSVFPKSVLLALPNALLSAFFVHVIPLWTNLSSEDFKNVSFMWSGYTGVLGFLLVFRTQIAYSRFWEGGTILQQVRGVWFNATSNLIAFCNQDESMSLEVEAFQHLLVRLMSMLYCAALQQVAVMRDEHFEVIGYHGLNEESLKFLSRAEDRCEVIMQWIQRSIVVNIDKDVLRIAPPIASRVFQELSNGIVDVQNARKITDFQFPFPYAQMLTVMLIMHWVMTPIVAGFVVKPDNVIVGALVVFVNVASFWSMNYIAAEIEMPFGDDPNDLPVETLQLHFNRSLRTLLNPLVQVPPSFDFQREYHGQLVVIASRLTDLSRAQHDGWPAMDGTYYKWKSSSSGTPVAKSPAHSEAVDSVPEDTGQEPSEVKLLYIDSRAGADQTAVTVENSDAGPAVEEELPVSHVADLVLTETPMSTVPLSQLTQFGSTKAQQQLSWLPCPSKRSSPGSDLKGFAGGRPLGLPTITLDDPWAQASWRQELRESSAAWSDNTPKADQSGDADAPWPYNGAEERPMPPNMSSSNDLREPGHGEAGAVHQDVHSSLSGNTLRSSSSRSLGQAAVYHSRHRAPKHKVRV